MARLPESFFVMSYNCDILLNIDVCMYRKAWKVSPH